MRTVALDLEEVGPYLLERGLLTPRDVVEGRFRVEDVSRLNRVFRVTSEPGYVLKVSAADDPERLEREAAVLERLASAPTLVGRVPHVLLQDRDRGVLVMRALGGAEHLRRCQRPGHFSRLLARAAARTLAALHSLPPATAHGLAPTWSPGEVFRVHDLDLERLRTLSGAGIELVGLIQRDGRLTAALDELVGTVELTGMIHGDLRWENCLGLPAPTGTRRTQVQLVDWEFATAGDAAVDVGVFFGEYLRAWVPWLTVMHLTPEAEAQAFAVQRRLRAAVTTFWSHYANARPQLEIRDARRLLRRAVRFAGARLLQVASEEAQANTDIGETEATLLRAATRFVHEPDVAGVQLLGLRPTWATR
jgi:aminoglycoside phosphotransferase (APT) family kinase protein